MIDNDFEITTIFLLFEKEKKLVEKPPKTIGINKPISDVHP